MMHNHIHTWTINTEPLHSPGSGVRLMGEQISSPKYDASDWVPVRIPNTIVGGLVDAGLIPDPFIADRITEIPGFKNVPNHFGNYPKPEGSPFRDTWWLRAVLVLENADLPELPVLRLRFHGVNPGADIWLNGKHLASSAETRGAYRQFDLLVTDHVNWQGENVLAVGLPPVETHDLGITFIDWNPAPPDDSAGIWRPVHWDITGPLTLRDPSIRTNLAADHWEAAVHPQVTVRNSGTAPVEAVVAFSLGDGTAGQVQQSEPSDHSNREGKPVRPVDAAAGGRVAEAERVTAETDRVTRVTRTVQIPAGEDVRVSFPPEEFRELKIRSPRIWWPYQLGAPELYTGDFTVQVGRELSDRQTVPFGIRYVEARLNDHGSREFRMNGVAVPINGAAWSPDLLLRQDPERDRIDIQYVKNMKLNAIRLEGKLASDEFWDLCDREGILVLAGWPCCNHFEKWDRWKPTDPEIAEASLRSQIQRLRNHPSFVAWMYGSDEPPPEEVERMYRDILAEMAPDLPIFSSATAKETRLGGPTGLKMSGPYEYEPPGYWYDPSMPGSAEGFNTETCPACALPEVDSIRRMYGVGEPEPGSSVWDLHCAGHPFDTTRFVEDAIRARFGWDGTVEELSFRSQYLGYETWRAMFEAYRHAFPRSTGVVGWMLNSAWPSLRWQLYDFWYHPTGSFFGTQTACAPVHAYLTYHQWVVFWRNDTGGRTPESSVTVRVFDAHLNEVWRYRHKGRLAPGEQAVVCMVPPNVTDLPFAILFVTLQVGLQPQTHNVYWRSNPMDKLVPADQSDWYFTPVERHADLSALFTAPEGHLDISARQVEGTDRLAVTLANTYDVPVLPVRLRLWDTDRKEYCAPILWSTNYVSVLSGETVNVSAQMPTRATGGFELHLSGPNCPVTNCPVTNRPVAGEDST